MILTALPAERQAVVAHLTLVGEKTHPQGTVYTVGRFPSSDNSENWDVAVAEIGPFNDQAAAEAERAINFFRPRVALFVGVAGGLKDVQLGDVVAATDVFGYESGKSGRSFEARPDVGSSSYRLVQRARAESTKGDWLGRIQGPVSGASPRVYVAPIAAGAKVVASSRSDIYRFIRRHYGAALAVEMEGRGFLRATHANDEVLALVIRGVSDLIEGKREADASGWQQIAARHASAFAFQVLDKLGRAGDTVKEGSEGIGHEIASGLRDIHADYTVNFQNFVDSYLGPQDQPVPFGGRSVERNALDAWLHDDGGPRRLLLVAPAGRGKSALLLRWTLDLMNRDGIAVVFIPVSIRFQTNLPNVYFSALAARLAQLHGESVLPSIVDTPAGVWRSMAVSLLARPLPDGRKLVVILDGADESADLPGLRNLLSVRATANLSFVVSARYLAGDADGEPWLARLGWEGARTRPKVMELTVLDRDEVGDVLDEMGFPLAELSNKMDVVSELHRLSGGDPLLVRLYVDDMWSRGEEAVRLRPEDLRAIKPGLDGYLSDYFRRWKLDQEELWADKNPLSLASVGLILDLLCCAIGPLRLDDIQSLMPSGSELRSRQISEAIERLGRLVIGDGDRRGYVFQHSLLNAHFYERLSDTDRAGYESLFRAWADRTLAALDRGDIAPEAAPPYLVQYYGLHLVRSKASTEEYLKLVRNEWRLAWEALSKTYSGFLDDVARAWNAAEEEDCRAAISGASPRYLDSEVLCALCFASVSSVAGRIPIDLLMALVDDGYFSVDEALAYIGQIKDTVRRALALQELSTTLGGLLFENAMRDLLAAVRELGEERERRTRGDGSEWRPGRHEEPSETALHILQEAVPRLPDGLIAEAFDTAQAFLEEGPRAGALGILAPRLSEDKLRRLLGIAQRMKTDHARSHLLGLAAPYLPDDLLPIATSMAWSLRGSPWETAIAALLPRLPSDQAERAFSIAGGLPDPDSRAEAMGILGSGLSVKLRRRAVLLVLAAKDDKVKLAALEKMAPALGTTAQRAALKSFVDGATDETAKAEGLVKVVPLLSESDIDWALSAASSMKRLSNRRTAFAGIARLKSPAIANRLYECVENIESEPGRTRMLASILCRCPAGVDARLSALLSGLSSANNRAELILVRATRTSIPVDGVLEALEVYRRELRASDGDDDASMFEPRTNPIEILWAVAHRASAPQAQRALAIAGRLWRSRYERLNSVATLIPSLPQPDRDRELEGLIAELRSVNDPPLQSSGVRWLAGLAPRLHDDRLLDLALEEARRIGVPAARANALASLSAALGEPPKRELLQEALAAARIIGDDFARVMSEQEMALRQPEPGWDSLLPIASAVPGADDRFTALTRLAGHLEEPSKSAAVRTALAALPYAGGHMNPPWRRLEEIAPLLDTPDLFQATRDMVCTMAPSSESSPLALLGNLAPRLPQARFGDLLHAVCQIPSERTRAETLARLVPHVPEAFLQEATEVALALSSPRDRVEALGSLVERLSQSDLGKLVADVQGLASLDDRAAGCALLVQHLVPPMAVAMGARALGDFERLHRDGRVLHYTVNNALMCLITGVPEELLGPALDLVEQACRDEHGDSRKLTIALARRLTTEFLTRTIDLVRSKLVSEYEWCTALVAIAERVAVLGDHERAINLAIEADRRDYMHRGLPQVIQHLPAEQVEGLLAAAEQLHNDHYMTAVIKAALKRLVELGFADSAYDHAAGQSPDCRIDVRVSAFPFLARERQPSAAKAILDDLKLLPRNVYSYGPVITWVEKTEYLKVSGLCEIAAALPDSFLSDAVAVALHIRDEGDRARALRALRPSIGSLAGRARFAIWAECLRHSADRNRDGLLCMLPSLAVPTAGQDEQAAPSGMRLAAATIFTWWP